MKPNHQHPDFSIHYGGSISLFVPLTDAAREWLDQHCSGADNQYLGRNLCVEHRYINDFIRFAINDGLVPPSALEEVAR
jgi:hypothetical protein